jgi:hypothetical protein
MTASAAKSIRARLKRIADESGEDFQRVLDRFGLERLLYRISVSPHAERYVLKGALLFSAWFEAPHRPTRDADFLGYGPDDIASSERTFRDIAAMTIADGLEIDPDSVRGSDIRLEQGYGGVRVEMNATLDGARIKLQADIGFGDAITPRANTINFPVLLEELPAPRLRVYPRATVIAEKLHAICVLGIANSRMKDYFDLRALVLEGRCDDDEIATAVEATFRRRETAVPTSLPIGLSDVFSSASGKASDWASYLRRNRLEAPDLPTVVGELARALRPALDRARSLSAGRESQGNRSSPRSTSRSDKAISRTPKRRTTHRT